MLIKDFFKSKERLSQIKDLRKNIEDLDLHVSACK